MSRVMCQTMTMLAVLALFLSPIAALCGSNLHYRQQKLWPAFVCSESRYIASEQSSFAWRRARVKVQMGDPYNNPRPDLAPELQRLRESLMRVGDNTRGLSIREKEAAISAAAGESAESETASKAVSAETQAPVKEGPSDEPAKEEAASPLGAVDGTTDPLGLLVATVGNKRLYSSDVPTLASIPVWKKQRIYRRGRAEKMARDKMKNVAGGGVPDFPGVITLAELTEASDLKGRGKGPASSLDRYGIIDGQHRVGALNILHARGVFTGKVLVEVFQLDTEAAVSEMFADINKAEPVQMIDLPGQISDKERRVLQSAVGALEARFPEMFKESVRCRKPHLSGDKIRNELFFRGPLQRYRLNTDEKLLAWLLERNSELERRSDTEWLDGEKKFTASFAKALSKARSHGLFLGMEDTWLDA